MIQDEASSSTYISKKTGVLYYYINSDAAAKNTDKHLKNFWFSIQISL